MNKIKIPIKTNTKTINPTFLYRFNLKCVDLFITRFAVNVFCFEISGFEGDQCQRGIGWMVAKRDE